MVLTGSNMIDLLKDTSRKNIKTDKKRLSWNIMVARLTIINNKKVHNIFVMHLPMCF